MADCGPTQYKSAAEWVYAEGGQVPNGAVPGGEDSGETIYVARAHHGGDNIPGKLHPSHECVYIPWGGEEHSHREYQVLVNYCGSQLEWKYASEGEIPTGAIQGGATADGEVLYIGRTLHEGTLTIGKVHPSHGVLYIAYGGQEISYPNYEILVLKSVTF
ncbi:natterin-4-like [Limulus polyphemus]|uniref:Natterin-4-like n=1 Tax=Limulus polyphemus TaxID=6850 RepID=A0ABM1B8I4_LIMPO|nr:natterin-4-like [Limulus polyphemus]